jgi:CRP-like cAMP-binding protein
MFSLGHLVGVSHEPQRRSRATVRVYDTALARRLNFFVKLSKGELDVLADLQSKPVKLKRGLDLIGEEQTNQKAFVLQDGWGCSFKIMPNGGRQVIGFPIPGDCVGLGSMLLPTSDYSFSVVTDAMVSAVEASRMFEIFRQFPRLGAAFLWLASRDQAMTIEHLTSIGRRTAIERTAHLFMELAERLTLVGLATETQFNCPLNQYLIADAIGLSSVHHNRILRQLRERNLLTVRSGKVIVHDIDGLRSLAGYRSVNAVSQKLILTNMR